MDLWLEHTYIHIPTQVHSYIFRKENLFLAVTQFKFIICFIKTGKYCYYSVQVGPHFNTRAACSEICSQTVCISQSLLILSTVLTLLRRQSNYLTLALFQIAIAQKRSFVWQC